MKTTIMKLILAVATCVALCQCSDDEFSWSERHEPTTDAERRAVAEHVERVLATTPRTLSGHDQDWDDAIARAYREARNTLCRPTLWEWKSAGFPRASSGWTGRWRYADEMQVK